MSEDDLLERLKAEFRKMKEKDSTFKQETLERVAQIKEEEWEKKLETLKKEYQMLTDPKYRRAVQETSGVYESIDNTADNGSLSRASDSVGGLSSKFSGFGILMEVLSPVIQTINGLLDVFIGNIMIELKPAFESFALLLNTPGVQDTISFVAELFANTITPILQGIGTFLNMIFGGEPPPTGAAAGQAIGTIVGGIIGMALGALIGLPVLGALIGGWLGGVIGSTIGGMFDTDTSGEVPVIEDVVMPDDGGTLPVELGGGGGGLVMMDDGGIATSPTTAMIGERRPEAILPLEELSDMMPSDNDQLILIRDNLQAQNRVLSTKKGIQRRRFG